MGRAQPIDHGQVLEAVRAVSAAPNLDAVGRVALEQIAVLVPSTVITLNEVDPAGRRATWLCEPESFVIPPLSAEEWPLVAAEHPMIVHLEKTGDGSARRISDFWTQDEFHRSLVYERVYRALGIEYQMSITLPEPRPVIVSIVCNRATSDFDERDRAVLNLLRPHLAQAWRNARMMEQLQAMLSASARALAADDAGVILIDDGPHEYTPGALVELYRCFGPPGRSDPLPLRVQRWLTRERDRLSSERPALATTLSTTHDGRRVTLRYLPAGSDHPEAILLRTGGHPRSPQAESAAVGLTPREGEVLQLVSTGDSNAVVARKLGVSPGTVKKHLDNIYAKLGVTSRGQAVALLRETFSTDRI